MSTSPRVKIFYANVKFSTEDPGKEITELEGLVNKWLESESTIEIIRSDITSCAAFYSSHKVDRLVIFVWYKERE